MWPPKPRSKHGAGMRLSFMNVRSVSGPSQRERMIGHARAGLDERNFTGSAISRYDTFSRFVDKLLTELAERPDA